MASKYTDLDRERAIQLYSIGNSLRWISKELNIPFRTIGEWVNKPVVREEIARVRTKTQIEFAEEASEIIGLCTQIIKRDLNEVIEGKRTMPTKDVSTIMGVMYDKKALSTGGSTSNINANITDEDRELLENVSKRLKNDRRN